MKHPLKRILVTLLLGALLLGSASCSRSEGWPPFRKKPSACEQAVQTLEAKFEELKARVTGGRPEADRASFWQATAALFAVLCGFALVGGAALGSRARRERERFRRSTSTPEETTTDHPEESIA